MSYIFETSGVGLDFSDVTATDDFTVEMKVYIAPETSSEQTIPLLSGTSDSGFDYSIQIIDGQLMLWTDTWRGALATTNTSIESGVWHHIAIVRGPDSSRLKIYVDGILDTTSGVGLAGAITFDTLGSYGSDTLDGGLDEVRLWDVARSEEEIASNAAGSLDLSSGIPTGLQRYYNFDTDTDHIVDLTGQGETGHDLHLPTGTAIVEDPDADLIEIGDESGFIDTTVASGLFLPTDMDFLPDGRMLVTLKSGVIMIYDDPTVANSASEVYLDISDITLEDREAGLLNIELDPDFENNGYFYLMYTNEQEERTTVSRFQHQENTGGTSSRGLADTEEVLWREYDTYSYADHQGGGLAIAYEPIDGNDPSPYKLYITIGEEFVAENSQDLTHDDGKVHRVNLTNGLVPADNPYFDPVAAAAYTPEINTLSAISYSAENLALDPDGVLTTIYSYGVRNPWRAEYDQVSGTLFIGEVGGGLATSSEDVHIAVAGANMGWPAYEGYLPDETDPGNPIWGYSHSGGPGQDDLDLYGNVGAAISGGVVYRGDQFPTEYEGVYFYGDWVRKWIRYLEIDYSSGSPVVVSDNHFKNATGQVLSFKEGPDGSLYYISTFQTGNMFTYQGSVNRLYYGGTNHAPAGVGIVLDDGEDMSASAPYTVTFDTDAYDPDGDDLTYLWSFGDGVDIDGDGIGDTATSTERSPSYTYTEPGSYRVELIATDSQGAQTVYSTRTITIGNAPVVTIDSPLDGMTFRAGDVITLTGSAFDAEDGVLSGADVFWSMALVHNEHRHPEFSAIENVEGGISFEIASTGHDYYTNVRYQIFLTAIDSDGLQTTTSVYIYPEESITTYDMPDVSGFAFLLDGLSYTGDIDFDNLIGYVHQIEVPDSYVDGGVVWEFSHWADDPSLTSTSRTYVVPETDTTIAPVYVQGAELNQQALSLDGTAGVDVEDFSVGGGGADFTIEAWVSFTDPSINNVDGFAGKGSDWRNGMDINFYAGQARLYDSRHGDLVVASAAIAVNTPTHVAFVREDGIASVYINGVLDTVGTINWTDSFDIDKIGWALKGGNAGLEGIIDDLRFWTDARSASEIATYYDQSITTSETNLLANFRFDGTLDDGNAATPTPTLPTGAVYVDPLSGNAGPVNTAPSGTGIVLDPGEDDAPAAPYTVTFESDVTDAEGHALVYAWDFGDGNVSSEIAPSHTYADDGTYEVTLTVTDELGASTTFDSVSIEIGNTPPVAVDDLFTLDQGFDPLANHLHILDNDSDPDGSLNMQMVEVLSGPTFGTIEIIDTDAELLERGLATGHYGHAEYVPTDSDFVGTDSFTYRVQDNEGAWSNVATATIVVTDPTAVPGQALSLNGSAGVDVEDFSLGEGGADFTIEAWVSFTGGAINNVDGIAGAGSHWRNGMDINFYAGKARIYDSNYGDMVVAETSMVANTPAHIAFVRENGIASVYINGVLDAVGTESWFAAFNIDKVGWGLKGGDAGLEGIIDDLRFWDVARSDTEIAAYYDQSITEGMANLVANYRFDGDLDDGNDATPLPAMPTGGLFVDEFYA
ncbi:LamG-like jellyroll fold domain-containing protein [Maricaulis maris]|uniref:LamG-like jellyroll fold domain-containing protein n=1 Tax=Maricaulis maris TaxID=74318 RepID=UPI003A8D0E88